MGKRQLDEPVSQEVPITGSRPRRRNSARKKAHPCGVNATDTASVSGLISILEHTLKVARGARPPPGCKQGLRSSKKACTAC